VTVVCLTDEVVERQILKLGAFGPLLIRAVADGPGKERIRHASALDDSGGN
jgi:hypothetical protein